MGLKDENSFIDKIEFAVAEYCNDCDDNDFNIIVSVSASDGWVKVKIEKERNQTN